MGMVGRGRESGEERGVGRWRGLEGEWEPDFPLPAQWGAMHRAVDPSDPCKRLVLAVLVQALWDIGKRRPGWEGAMAWVETPASAYPEWPVGFERVCETLGIEAGMLRRMILGRRTQREVARKLHPLFSRKQSTRRQRLERA